MAYTWLTHGIHMAHGIQLIINLVHMSNTWHTHGTWYTIKFYFSAHGLKTAIMSFRKTVAFEKTSGR